MDSDYNLPFERWMKVRKSENSDKLQKSSFVYALSIITDDRDDIFGWDENNSIACFQLKKYIEGMKKNIVILLL